MNTQVNRVQSGQNVSGPAKFPGIDGLLLQASLFVKTSILNQPELIEMEIPTDRNLNPYIPAWQPKAIMVALWLSQDVNSYAVVQTEKRNFYGGFGFEATKLNTPSTRFQYENFRSKPLTSGRGNQPLKPVEEIEFEAEFNGRVERIEKETAIYSSPAATYLHRDYLAIIAKGIERPKVVVPLILKCLSTQGGDWFFALEKITDENPAKDCTDYESAVKAWNNWAEQNYRNKESDALSTT